MEVGRFLCRDEQEREWFLDMHRRLSPVTAQASIVLAGFVVLCLPWFNPLSIVPILLAGLAFPIGERVMARTRRAEALVVAWFAVQTLFAVAIAINGREHLIDLAILVFPIVGASGGFPDRVVALCTGYTALLMIGLSFALDPDGVIDDPPTLLIPLGLLFAVAVIASAVRRASIENRDAAVVDPLTGMLNRSALAARASELAHQSRLTGRPVAMIVLDIDRFKSVNDRFGHGTGDRVLTDLAYRMRAQLRAFDLAYRLGGEEFLVLLPGTEQHQATRLAERIAQAIREEPVAGVEVTLSAGVAASPDGTPFDFDDVFAAADAALYAAKDAGRDCVRTSGGPSPPGPSSGASPSGPAVPTDRRRPAPPAASPGRAGP
jgi:diguanylate cyclase (GGDEF)-like protein